MESFMIEIRDRGTFVPALVTRIDPANIYQAFLCECAGIQSAPRTIVLTVFAAFQHRLVCSNIDCEEWCDRTFRVAHKYVEENFDFVRENPVVDVEFVNGETLAPKVSEFKEYIGGVLTGPPTLLEFKRQLCDKCKKRADKTEITACPIFFNGLLWADSVRDEFFPPEWTIIDERRCVCSDFEPVEPVEPVDAENKGGADEHSR